MKMDGRSSTFSREVSMLKTMTGEDVKVGAFINFCTKCRCERSPTVRFRQGPHPTRYRDYLEWHCGACGYTWVTETADYMEVV
jgi:hypothetical protein